MKGPLDRFLTPSPTPPSVPVRVREAVTKLIHPTRPVPGPNDSIYLMGHFEARDEYRRRHHVMPPAAFWNEWERVKYKRERDSK